MTTKFRIAGLAAGAALMLVMGALLGGGLTAQAEVCDGITLTMDGVEHCGTQPGGPGTDIVWVPLVDEGAEPVEAIEDLTLAERVSALEEAVAELQEAVGLDTDRDAEAAGEEPTPSSGITGGNE